MDDEINTFRRGDTDLEEPPTPVGSNQHDEVVHVVHSGRVAVGMQHVVVSDPVFSSTRQNHRVHIIKLH